jgi:hypothetical protein
VSLVNQDRTLFHSNMPTMSGQLTVFYNFFI